MLVEAPVDAAGVDDFFSPDEGSEDVVDSEDDVPLSVELEGAVVDFFPPRESVL